MINKIANKLATFICCDKSSDNLSPNRDELEILQYGIECIINTTVPVTIIFIYSNFTHQVLDMIAWLASFLLLRNYMGGYHASSQLKCMILSCIIGILTLFIESMLTSSHIIAKLLCFAVFIVFFSIKGPILQDSTFNSIKDILFFKGFLLSLLEMILIYLFLHHNNQIGNAIFIGAVTSYSLYFLEFLRRGIIDL